FWTRQAAIPGSTWALGWDTPTPEGSSAGQRISARSVGHLGFTGTSLWIDLERDAHVILLTNRVHPRRDNDAIKALRPEVHDAVLEALAELVRAGGAPFVVAGTPGRAPSAALLAWLLTRTGRDPGYLVGGLPRDLGASAALGTGPWFVVEGDEYDSAYFDKEAKFL